MWSARSQIAMGGCSLIPEARGGVVSTVHHARTHAQTEQCDPGAEAC